ncbi:glycosyltransferase 87 family protein [Streptomyces sp. MS19]|uniref:glycosyltransferase 87 family protein n=1 Tax=Streptomyces sp. MS19 TaxID=3385972 RepID=UPI0039A246C1
MPKHHVETPSRRVRPLLGRRGLWVAGWLAAACWAAATAAVSTLPPHRAWGMSATLGYGVAALAACFLPRPRARAFSVAAAVTGAVAVPFAVLALTGGAQSEVAVIERSAALLLHHGTPYLADAQAVTDYNPYLPAMAVFGIPAALLDDGTAPARLLGDARLWCALALLACLAVRAAPRTVPTAHAAPTASTARTARTAFAVLVASPLVALPLCVSGVDLPLAGLCWLGLALVARGRPGPAGLALACACALKWTALPAVAVAAALATATADRRAALRCAAVWLAGTLAAILPSALLSPGAMAEQVLAFPLGLADVPTPAASPLPGRLLADLGTAGRWTAVLLLACGGTVVAASLVTHPPRDALAAADRLAAGLCLAFLLAPAGRFGYFALPLLLVAQARIARPSERPAPCVPPSSSPTTSPHGRAASRRSSTPWRHASPRTTSSSSPRPSRAPRRSTPPSRSR